ncbi:DUF1059 domain-containing protein [Candidatus Nitrosocosmicus hydrocola]|uniref:DUF1059 domain-containing protein n=1 Tax=Candidatus Nitrosocosmicus hydrocola TaxID=1826872 RepID=UPI0011E5C6DE|nr:DUF1059 domain-containing protein [Candidatus Nitrosocosmicus hydrocola]
MLSFKCRDVGFDCNYELKEEIDDEIINKVKEHGQRDHNLKEEDFSSTLLEKIRGSIQVVK